MTLSHTLSLIGLSSLLLPTVMAQPPQQAIQACSNKVSNSSCQFHAPHGKVTGNCRIVPNGQAACVPNHHQRHSQSLSQQQHHNFATDTPPQHPRTNNQRGRRPHTVTQSNQHPSLIPANHPPITSNQISISQQGNQRIINANGISRHNTGQFPNRGNPHIIRTQNYTYRIPLQPKLTGKITPLTRQVFGIAVNGVPFDPGTAEVYQGTNWHYEALSNAVPLGLDINYAHVQPSGAYHYHAKPTKLLSRLGLNSQKHSPLVGWAADGFPIYAMYGYKQGNNTHSPIQRLNSSYRLKSGHRTGVNTPPGRYDGTFANDYRYINGVGQLDECNGRWTITPEFPRGTYAYFLSDTFPYIPRCFKGTPSNDFKHRIPGMRRG